MVRSGATSKKKGTVQMNFAKSGRAAPSPSEYLALSKFWLRGKTLCIMSKANRVTKASIETSLTAIAEHLGLSRNGARELEVAGIIDRNAGIDACRVRYINHLRTRRPKSVADEEWRRERAREIALRNSVRERELIEFSEAQATFEECMGIVLTELGSFPARAGKRDLKLRRELDQEVFDLRTRIADRFAAKARELKGPEKGCNR